jgi:peptide/nickel transport system substrate-binding protein
LASRKRRTFTVLLTTGVVSILAGCSSSTGPVARPTPQLTATIRSEPRTFNRIVGRDRISGLLGTLLYGKLVRLNLESQEIEPALAERWTASPDGRTWTLALRDDVAFSDGTPFTSDDVLFSFNAIYDERVQSPLADALKVDGKPLAVSAPDRRTVVVRFPAPFGPGLRLLDNLVIVPRHRLARALADGTFRAAWGLDAPLSDIVGLGPFTLAEYRRGERLVLARNPRYWKRAGDERLPRLDRLVLQIVPDQDAEFLRLKSGETDLVSSELRADDLAEARRLAAQGRLQLRDLGVSLDPDMLWFNLARVTRGREWVQRKELREAIATAVNRQAFADTVFLGAAVPISGPVTPGNEAWHDPSIPVPAYDPGRSRALLEALGLRDRDGDGQLETRAGAPARFTLITQKGNSVRERGAQFLQSELKKVGLGVDIVTLEAPAVIDRLTKGEYEAIYFVALASDTDPAANADFWRSSGAFHVWNPSQPTPATPWEQRLDALLAAQVATPDRAERRRLFSEMQRILAAELPVLYFVAPRVTVAMSPRVVGAQPALLQPTVLWNAESLGVK